MSKIAERAAGKINELIFTCYDIEMYRKSAIDEATKVFIKLIDSSIRKSLLDKLQDISREVSQIEMSTEGTSMALVFIRIQDRIQAHVKEVNDGA